eukprot:CAMPEP_0114113884 /NCGR_PEP_ID=MMETSP0043_2-20121206/3147_1 /TAXON_ID=464988 /ORGANISM="Hemiselmis andersenii, Strain CCMP644" /LENGTH=354 /DNA_ID=CAMNT_0001206057 /DNA_START=57 /DNA_END=1117 /DNA_ORIENTATION=+
MADWEDEDGKEGSVESEPVSDDDDEQQEQASPVERAAFLASLKVDPKGTASAGDGAEPATGFESAEAHVGERGEGADTQASEDHAKPSPSGGEERGEGGAEISSGAEQGSAKRFVDVTVVSAEHLPKSDVFGTCDGYAVLEMCGHRVQTTTKTNTYTPQWNEVFSFEIEGERKPEMTVEVYDWDRIGKHDFLGQFVIDADQEASAGGGKAYPLLTREGKPVVGHDKQPAHITLKFSISDEAHRVDFKVKVCKGSNMPKADVMGSCDPYVALSFGDKRHTTSVRKNTYHPTWNQTFGFSVDDAKAPLLPLKLALMDWDRLTRDDTLGEAVVEEGLVREALAQERGHVSQEITMHV